MGVFHHLVNDSTDCDNCRRSGTRNCTKNCAGDYRCNGNAAGRCPRNAFARLMSLLPICPTDITSAQNMKNGTAKIEDLSRPPTIRWIMIMVSICCKLTTVSDGRISVMKRDTQNQEDKKHGKQDHSHSSSPPRCVIVSFFRVKFKISSHVRSFTDKTAKMGKAKSITHVLSHGMDGINADVK